MKEKYKNRVIHVLPSPNNPKPRQCIVSAGQIVFVLDKEPAVQSLFHKNEFQHCHWVSLPKNTSVFLSVLTNGDVKIKIKYVLGGFFGGASLLLGTCQAARGWVGAGVMGRGWMGIRRGDFTMESSLI